MYIALEKYIYICVYEVDEMLCWTYVSKLESMEDV